MALEIVPVSLEEANAFVKEHHRHHGAVLSHKFSIGVAREDEIVGVVIVGRPVARGLQDGWTLEVTRCCVRPGARNAASRLYGAATKAAFAMGYRRVVTYVLDSEKGTSLRAANFRCVGRVRGRSWSCAARPRVDTHPLQDKLRFEIVA